MKLAVSACLLGQRVRYDGGHKLFPFLKNGWGGLVEFVSLCPETQAGLPTPREPVELFKIESANPHVTALRALGLKTGDDYTDQLSAWAKASLPTFDDSELLGFVLKSGSPSCGTNIRVNTPKTDTCGDNDELLRGSGLFVQALKEHLPHLPVTDELTLGRRTGREHFLARAFILRRWRKVARSGDVASCPLELSLQLEPFIRAVAPELAWRLTALASATSRGSPTSRASALAGCNELVLELLERMRIHEGALDSLVTCLDAEELSLVEASARFHDG